MSKYSPKDQISAKLEEGITQQTQALAMADKDDLTPEEVALLTADEFVQVGYDEAEAERAGYTNYSYWKSTFIMFLKNKLAVAMLVIMLVLVIFTFIQPYLPNQFDPNFINYYDENGVWITVTEDSKAEVSGIRWTRDEDPVEVNPEVATIAYVQVPESWGNPRFFCQGEDKVPVELTAGEHKGWYYVLVPVETPYLFVQSEDGTQTTYHQAVWITLSMTDSGMGAYFSSSKQTDGDLLEGAPEGTVLTYLQMPEEWGKPNVIGAGKLNGSEKSPVEFTHLYDNWYYAFIPESQVKLTIYSEDGSEKCINPAYAEVAEPTDVTPIKEFVKNQRPNSIFWFGTNDVGQDLWARMWTGTRTSLFIGLIVAAVEAVVGILGGLLWGYVRKLDFLFTEFYNLVNNIPSTIILTLASYVMRPGIKTIIIAMCITGWIGLARFIRNQVVIIRDRDFNLASRCLGTPTRRIIIKNLLPQMVSVIMLQMALAIPGAIGSEVFLAYIGLGLPIKTPSLGNLVNKGRAMMMAPTLRYQLIIPAIILSIITICFYLVGNAFSDAADPRNHV